MTHQHPPRHSHRHGPAPKLLTIGEVILKSAEYLAAKGVETPRLDAEVMLARLLKVTRLQLYMDWQKPLVELELAAYRESIRRRGAEREPVCRVIGEADFFGRIFEVTPAVFAPRPETEGVVERALLRLRREDLTTGSNLRPTVFEVGTGSGCISVTLAAEEAGVIYHASDLSAGALEVARRNAARHGVAQRIHFHEGALFAGFNGSINVLVSNPPYIRSGEVEDCPPEVRRHDPRLALDGGPDGLDVVRQIASEAPSRVVAGGAVILEIGDEQARDCRAIFELQGSWTDVTIERDLAGRNRYATAVRRG